MKSIVPIIWLILNLLCALLSTLSIIFSFISKQTSTMAQTFSLSVSIILHFMISFYGLRITSNIGPSFIRRLLLNFSFHFATTSLLFLIVNIRPFFWILILLLHSFYQVLNYMTIHIIPHYHWQNQFSNLITSLYRSMSGLYKFNLYISLFEIATLFQFHLFHQTFVESFTSTVYFIWYLLYRYSTNKAHKIIFNYIHLHLVSISRVFPNFISVFILKFCDIMSDLGQITSLSLWIFLT